MAAKTARRTTAPFHARTKTQQTLKARLLRLTRPDGEGTTMWQLSDRDSQHARDAMSMWQAEGVIEDVGSGSHSYNRRWRVTEQGVDRALRHAARVEFIGECLDVIAEQVLIAGAARAAIATSAGEVAQMAGSEMDLEGDSESIRADREALDGAWYSAQREWHQYSAAMRFIYDQRRMIESECRLAEACGDDVAQIMNEARAGSTGGGAISAEAGDPLGGDA